MANASLHSAKNAKNDEFYTRYEDVQTELNHYEKHFKGKTILCNCDDPFESNFCKFFLRNFNYLGLKRLICTSYHSSSVAGSQISLFDLIEEAPSEAGHGYVLDITKVPMANGRGVSDADIDKLLKSKKYVKELKGNGDFRSVECIDYLKQSDIVVTNPPFSLFREYIALLVEYKKDFLVIGNQNAITYKEIFPLIKDNKIWFGYHSGHTWFGVPANYQIPANYLNEDRKKMRSNGYKIDENGVIWRNLGNICWWTNLDHSKRHEKIVLYKQYDAGEYPKYDNYDAIEVSKVTDIPSDYNGIMGVPITFLDKYCPEQFEIVGSADANVLPEDWRGASKRIVEDYYAQGNKGQISEGWRIPIYYDSNGKVVAPYKRILIRGKE